MADAVYQCAPVVQAFHGAVGALEYVQDRERSKKAAPAHAGKSWSRAGDQQVCEELRRGIDFHQIAKTHNRTIGSIIARLVKLGRTGRTRRWICLTQRWHSAAVLPVSSFRFLVSGN
jgi:hypothetical protein